MTLSKAINAGYDFPNLQHKWYDSGHSVSSCTFIHGAKHQHMSMLVFLKPWLAQKSKLPVFITLKPYTKCCLQLTILKVNMAWDWNVCQEKWGIFIWKAEGRRAKFWKLQAAELNSTEN